MDKKELSEPVNNVPLIKEDMKSSNDVSSTPDSEKVIQRLNQQLKEAQELCSSERRTCIELQGHLDDERHENKQRAEESAKQMKLLQGQLKQLQEEVGVLKQQRDDASSGSQAAQEEVKSLRRALETAAAEREREVAAVHGNLATVTKDADKWRQAASKYESEISGLQSDLKQQGLQWQKTAEIQAGELQSVHQECSSLQKECSGLQKECSGLRSEKQDIVNKYEKELGGLQKDCEALRTERDQLLRSHQQEKSSLQADTAALRADNDTMLKKHQQLEKELSSARGQNVELSSSLVALERSQGELETRLAQLKTQHLEDSSTFQARLEEAQSQAKDRQRECEEAQTELSELKEKYESCEQEKRSVTEQLQECKADMKVLQEGRGSKSSLMLPVQAIVIGLILALLLWCLGALW